MLTVPQDGSQSSDRRRYPRFACEGCAEVVVDTPSFLFRGRIRDISLTGCFIETRASLHLERRTAVEMRFTVEQVTFSTLARIMVVRDGKGAGFEFLPLDERTQEHLLTLIHRIESLQAQAAADASDDVTSECGAADTHQ